MNFFLPGLKLGKKWREGSHWRKRYEPAQTGYQRLMQLPELPRRRRRELRDRFKSLDPFALKAEVEKWLRTILAGSAGGLRQGGVTRELA